MEQRLMQLSEFRQLYDTCMGNHFPADEIKPFSIMEKVIKEGKYYPYGYYEGETLLAYTCLLKKDTYFLLDYFAVMEEGRGNGTGSQILEILQNNISQEESILLEVEEPLSAEPDVLDLQKRRIQFYLRNHALYTELKAEAFGVPYLILNMGKELKREQAQKAMSVLYHTILTEEMYEKNVRFALDKQK